MAFAWAMAVIAVLAAAEGVAAVRTGWVLPWIRRRVLRPRLWGYGMLITSIGVPLALTTPVFLGRSDALRDPVVFIGYVLIVGGCVVQAFGYRLDPADRAPEPGVPGRGGS
ncbi:hypothetical protein ACIQNU_12805 [Streptomyces sp. NPDC091292]|uniref:hypothetical protein n=1 Tax=Streptomyces sp. NPDC091292 TaxID=3365991 RepID=UPI00382C0C00